MSNANNSCIPRLRFPGFEGEWEERKLGDSFDERTEKNRGELPLLSLGEEGLMLQSETARKDNSNADKFKYLRVAVGDIAYNTMRMWQGRCVCAKIEGIVSPAYTVCIPKDGIDSLFHYYLFKTQRMIQTFHKHSQGLVSDTLNLKYEAFSKIKYCLPPTPEEQQKIASCLSELDNLIAAQGQKVDALKEKKKGLMQQLFPQPGETTPRLRFPGFEGEWVEKKLGEVFEKINNGMAYNTYLTEGYPMSRIETISSGEIDYDRVGYSDIEPNEKYKLLVGDLLFSHINSETRIGRIAMYRGEKALYHGMNLLLLRAGHLYDKFFVFYQMDRTETRTNIQKLAKKAINQASVSTSDLKQVSVMIPPYLPEQQKIASCLSSLDDLITAESAKVEALKDHKKGLMQQLFPQPAK